MGVFLFVLCFVIIFLDLIQKVSLTKKLHTTIYGIISPHIFIILYIISKSSFISEMFLPNRILLYAAVIIYFLYVLIRISIIPNMNKDCANFRVRIEYDGAAILKIALKFIALQVIIYIALMYFAFKSYISFKIYLIDFAILLFIIIALMINGALRVLFCCRRLGLVRRIVLFFTIWIPIVNIFLIKYMIMKVNEEYKHTCDIECMQNIRRNSDICATRYPILMLHGIGFNDMKYINYWGRIPRYLIKYGANIYYGHQEAWGTVENNASEVREKILNVLRENNCSKVNIIAHSKGGLDARYLISKLNMGQCVASLTTISTPHYGSEVMNLLIKMPEKLYKYISNVIDKAYLKLGDKRPDCYNSSRQLLPSYCIEFNKKIINDNRVYYQSYGSAMKSVFGDSLLGIGYGIMRLLKAGENDGLVSSASARWGNFRGIFKNKYRRGISHGDIIDLKREDYKGFDPIEAFIKIVSDLKKKGF